MTNLSSEYLENGTNSLSNEKSQYYEKYEGLNTLNESKIPRLEDYDINPVTGFLPATPPLKRLENPYYAPWEELIAEMKDLLLAGKFRRKVLKLKILDTSKLNGLKEYQRAFSVLTFLQHAFVWGKNEPVSQIIPPCIAIPLVEVSNYLEINPVSCNAAVVVWNWKLIDEDEPIGLNNLATINSFTGSLDEAWFYLNTVAIEAAGGSSLSSIISALHSIKSNDTPSVERHLQTLSQSIDSINRILKRMFDKCDPYLFYWKLRPYLAGWENMAEAGLPYGVLYQGVDDIGKDKITPENYRKYAGGSAAQSALIQALDIGLGIVHYPTNAEWRTLLDEDRKRKEQGLPPVKRNRANYLYSMRAYMPGLHRKFLEDLTEVANIKQYVEKVGGMCVHYYNDCVAQLKRFRDLHIQVVTRYIVLPARKGPSIGSFSIDTQHTIEPENLVPENRTNIDNSSSTSLMSIPENDKIDIGGSLANNNTSSAISIPNKKPTRSFTTGSSPSNNISPGSNTPKGSPRLVSIGGSTSVDILYPQLNHKPGTSRKIIVGFNADHGIARTVTDPDNETFRGTGGTDLMPFLKQVRDETQSSLLVDDKLLFPPL